jgi:hypothetical protein
MKVVATVYEPMYEYNDKKYIRLTLPPNTSRRVFDIHQSKHHLLTNPGIDIPLEGSVLKVKVPFRYRRVMCEVRGRPIQSLVKGDTAEIDIEFKGAWNVGNHSGFSWILKSIESI